MVTVAAVAAFELAAIVTSFALAAVAMKPKLVAFERETVAVSAADGRAVVAAVIVVAAFEDAAVAVTAFA